MAPHGEPLEAGGGRTDATTAPPWPAVVAGQGRVGLLLAGAVLGGYLANLVVLQFVLDIARHWPIGLALALLQCWLSVGLFIVAHDCMHGSALPGHRRAGDWLGRLCLLLYAGFPYDRLRAAHHEHHRWPGSARDPDFDSDHASRLLPWFLTFVRRYFGWREFGVLTVLLLGLLALGAPLANVLAFWAVPAMLSALQLFYFGTYLPHRHGSDAFADAHNSRSLDVPAWMSLLACYHFGYHHEHHLFPYLPWWRLPRARSLLRSGA